VPTLAALDRFGIERLDVATLQAVSGAGYSGVSSMEIIDNAIPHIGGEEEKMETESRKLLGDFDGAELTLHDAEITASCNRIPTIDGHLENVFADLRDDPTAEAVREAMRGLEGVDLPSSPDQLIKVFGPDDPDRHCLFVLDRSGSMSGEVMGVAERAMGMLAFALESVDVDVAVLELYERECRLAKPFCRPVDAARDRLFHGHAKGGTPLADTLHIGRGRLAEEGPGSFLFVVTDGTPAEPERYMDALERCPMPVVGINLSTDTPAGRNYFHRQVTVAPDREDLRRTIRQLLQEVLFG